VHANGDKTDNRLENLVLTTPGSLAERFRSRAPVGPVDQCWEWPGLRHRQGYGVLWFKNEYLLAHRVGYELAFGPIGEGLYVCHRCDNPPCVNPSHLFAGTQKENLEDMARKRRTRRLTREQVAEAQSLWERGMRLRDVAERFGVHEKTISREARIGHPRGERNYRAKLTERAVAEIRSLKALSIGPKALAWLYGVTPSAIAAARSGKTWRHLSGGRPASREVCA
jgi:hypothetical protein